MKRRLLAFLLAFVMTFSLVPVNTFAAEADAAVHYTNITTESGENVTVEYVETVVGEAAWGESINTPYYHVTIPEGTGKVLLTYPESVKLVLSGDDGAVFFYRNTYPGQSEIALGGALTVATNDDGSKTVTIPVESFMRSAAGSVAVGMAYYVDGENQSAAEFFDFTYAALTHAVTLTSGEGYTLTGEATVEDGKDYSFTVTIADDYEMEDNFVVKANGETLTAGESGSYTVENVTADLTITVEGVVKKQAAGHAVTLTPGEGYTLTGEATAEDGKDYTFTVTVSEGYDAANMVVKVNGEEVTAVDGKYTVEKVSSDLTITVSGVKKIIIGLSALRFGSTDSIRSAKYFDMTPSFDPAVKEYTLLVPDSTNAVYAWATRGADLSTKASIKATWTSMSTGEASNTTLISGSSSGKNLSGFNIASAESNTLTLTVTDDGSTDVYTVKTVRIDPSLTKLALDGVKVNETFSATKKTYTAMTTKDSVTVLATPRGEDYTVTYNGETSNVIPLSAGENKIEIVVTNKDGYTSSYTITVTKADHAVTIPTDESYLVTGKEAVMDGADYTFKVEVDYRYEAGEDFAVKVNGETVTGEKGVYTVKNVTTDLVITVEGATKKVLKPVTVYFSFSHDDKFESCEQSGQTVALKKVTVPYFDLALYGLEDFYFASEDYGPASGDPTGGPGSALDPGTKEFAYGKITMLHLFLYATEVYYLGIDPADAGKGYLANNGIMGTDIFSYTGSTGSIFLQNIWNYDLNLNYYLNYEYPLASAGWGSTCDQILLREGDIVTLGHFSDWSFFNDTTSIFNYIVADKTDPVQGDKIKLELYHAGADMYGTYNTAHTLIDYSPSVYCTPVNDIVSGDVTTWQYVGNAEADGSLVVDTSTLAPGEYIFALAGQPGKENSGVICSTPGGIRLTIHEKPVVKGDINGDGVINSTDVMALFNAINSGDDLDATVADVNGDGVIDARDVMALYNIIKSDN